MKAFPTPAIAVRVALAALVAVATVVALGASQRAFTADRFDREAPPPPLSAPLVQGIHCEPPELDFVIGGHIAYALDADCSWRDAASGASPDLPVRTLTVDLLAPGPDGALGTADDLVVDSVMPDANGAYSFEGCMKPGTRTWAVRVPQEIEDTYDLACTTGGAGPGLITVVLNEDARQSLGNDFGYAAFDAGAPQAENAPVGESGTGADEPPTSSPGSVLIALAGLLLAPAAIWMARRRTSLARIEPPPDQ